MERHSSLPGDCSALRSVRFENRKNSSGTISTTCCSVLAAGCACCLFWFGMFYVLDIPAFNTFINKHTGTLLNPHYCTFSEFFGCAKGQNNGKAKGPGVCPPGVVAMCPFTIPGLDWPPWSLNTDVVWKDGNAESCEPCAEEEAMPTGSRYASNTDLFPKSHLLGSGKL